MINYAIDNIQYTNNKSCFHITCKGWVLDKNYAILVKSNYQEIYRFKGNQKRYDICIANHIDITEDNYGFDIEFDVPNNVKMIVLYALTDKKEYRLYSMALNNSQLHHEKFNNIIDSIKRSVVSNLNENHALPLSRMFKGFLKKIKGDSPVRLFNPSNNEDYQEWLKTQKHSKSKDSLFNITIITNNKEIKCSNIDIIYADVLNLNDIHTDYIMFVGKQVSLYEEIYSYFSECEKYDLTYFDNDSLENNVRVRPQFKPDFSYDTLHAVNYIGHAFVVKKELLKELDNSEINLYQYLLKLSDKTKKYRSYF